MFQDLVNFIKNFASNLPFNIFDYSVGGLFLLYIFEDISFGLIASGISLISTVFSFFIGLAIYPTFSAPVAQIFNLPKGIADAISFLTSTVLSFVLVSYLLSIIRRKFISLTFPKLVDRLGGALFGSLSFFFIASFAVALLLAFPTSTTIRDSIKNSYSAPLFSNYMQGMNAVVRLVFGGAIEDTINFLTVKPNSNATIDLNFKTAKVKVDEVSESKMLEQVNIERRKAGVAPLELDIKLQDLAREYAKDMLSRGSFSHYTPERLSPFDRMASANISYQYAGENLAFAPDVGIAMNGLMKSQGHRENMLNPNFRRVGIGVIDAGLYGKMFVQEFTD